MWTMWGDDGSGSALASLCRTDLTAADFFKNDLGRFTPCFIDLAVLGLAHTVSIVIVTFHLGGSFSRSCSRYKLQGWARTHQCMQVTAAALCALVPVLELNARLGQAATDPDSGPAPHEYAAAGLATISWALLTVLFAVELNSYVPVGRWAVRFAVTFMASSELVKLRILLYTLPTQDYFFYLYLAYVGLQCCLTLWALCWGPSNEQLVLEHEAYSPLASEAQYKALRGSDSPESQAGILSYMTFYWLTPLLSAGYKGKLNKDQIPELPPADKLDRINAEFEKNWKAELAKGASASLGNACWRTVRPLFLKALPFKLLNDFAQFVGPVFLNMLLGVIADKEAPMWKGYMYSGLMLAGTVIGLLGDHQHFHLTMRAGFRLSAAVGAQVHAKVLRLTPAARGNFSSGRVFSLISSDAETLNSVCWSALSVISAPLRMGVAVYLLYSQLGISCLVTIACLLLLIPLNIWLVRWSGGLLKVALTHTDERTKLEGELVGGIEVVKCSAWEVPFLERITASRAKELFMLWRVAMIQAFMAFFLTAVPTIIPMVTFAAYLLLGNNLSSAEAFTALTLFNVLRFPMFLVPMLLQMFTQARISAGRIQEFLVADSMEDVPPLPPANAGEAAISLHGDFSWSDKGVPSLADVNLDIPAGQLVVVVGPTGSGKTSLLSAILGQMQQMYGPAPVVKGRVAYVPQSAFIVNATVRDNILFGARYDAEHFEECIRKACMDTDLSMLAGGDLAELGDKGVNLSGGQRQRLSLARALYSDADVFILDDPLSALDSKVGKKVFETAIKDSSSGTQKRMFPRTVILATNQLSCVQASDLVLFMAGGKVVEAGPYSQLINAGGQFAAMMKEVQVDEEQDQEPAAAGTSAAAGRTPSAIAKAEGNATTPGAKLNTEEAAAEGSISSEVYGKYITAMGGTFWFLWLMLSFIVAELLRTGTTVWLSYWTGSTDSGDDAHGPMYYLDIYSGISCLLLLSQMGNILENARLCVRAADHLHRNLVNSLLTAPLSFFHTTPLGRIVNRLTKDTSEVDRQLSSNVNMALRMFLQLLSTIALVGVIAPLALPPLVVIMLGFYLLFTYFQTTLRQVKRLEAISRSPVFTSLTEAITGVATIKAFGSGPRLVKNHAKLLDTSVANTHACNCLNRWLGVRLEFLGAFATFLAAMVAVEQRTGANEAGLALSSAMSISVLMALTLRAGSQAENSFNSVERICEYSSLPVEGSDAAGGSSNNNRGHLLLKAQKAKDQGTPGWPSKGEVEFKQVTMRYRPGLPLVLRGVSFKAAATEKVGIVGRTGAGKSSMIGCLFRLTEVEGGSIIIDGVNIATLPLHRLRSSMALIPQVPVLFTGTIRLNLSPFGLHSDAELWNALRRAHLAAVVEAWPAGLDTVLQEGGAPLSAGQKQLLALGRAQLNPSRVLVLDEATANVDVETDAVIQKTMRTEFKDRTILAIAHRLHTIIDYDKVLVLDRGLVSEFGAPAELLAIPDGVFTSMVNDTGEATAKFLNSVATGKVNLSDSISEAAKDGMEKLSTPLPAEQLQQLLQAGLPRGLLLKGLAKQLMERSQAVTKLVKEVTLDLVKNSQLVEDDLAAEALMEQVMAREGEEAAPGGGSAAQGMTEAQKSMLQALEMLVQVQQYAEAAAATVKVQQGEAGEDSGNLPRPTNLKKLRSSSLGRPVKGGGGSLEGTASEPVAESVDKLRVRSAKEELMRQVLQKLVKPIAFRPADEGEGSGSGEQAVPSPRRVTLAETVAEVEAATRRAGALGRARSMQRGENNLDIEK